MGPRIDNPALTVPGALPALQALAKAGHHPGVPEATHALVHLRASQINGCAVCVDMHANDLVRLGEAAERIHGVAVWRDTPYYDDAERAALALAEAVTRLADATDAVPDAVWDEAARHYAEPALGALLISIATINVWNRLNAATHQVPGAVAA